MNFNYYSEKILSSKGWTTLRGFMLTMWAYFRFLWRCIVSKLWSERENQQDETVRCLLSTLSQHVSGIIMPETCWESVDNKHLTVSSCWFSLSLHNVGLICMDKWRIFCLVAIITNRQTPVRSVHKEMSKLQLNYNGNSRRNEQKTYWN